MTHAIVYFDYDKRRTDLRGLSITGEGDTDAEAVRMAKRDTDPRQKIAVRILSPIPEPIICLPVGDD